MHVYGPEDGPSMQLELPVEIVETLLDVVRRHVTPNMGLDGAFIDELRGQLADHRELELADRICSGLQLPPQV